MVFGELVIPGAGFGAAESGTGLEESDEVAVAAVTIGRRLGGVNGIAFEG
ncbi:MAG TPA: hypothetical protein VLE69_02625 [Candidatus Saccharimonadales bacterium]|nr:hypothetical protein [Candidatus Saccharimonadales bacterium]